MCALVRGFTGKRSHRAERKRKGTRVKGTWECDLSPYPIHALSPHQASLFSIKTGRTAVFEMEDYGQLVSGDVARFVREAPKMPLVGFGYYGKGKKQT